MVLCNQCTKLQDKTAMDTLYMIVLLLDMVRICRYFDHQEEKARVPP